MSVVIADRAIDLAQDGTGLHLLQLSPQTGDHVGHFLTQCRGTRGLAMGAGQHGGFGFGFSHRGKGSDDLFHLGYQHSQPVPKH